MKSLIINKSTLFSIILCFSSCARITNIPHSGHASNMYNPNYTQNFSFTRSKNPEQASTDFNCQPKGSNQLKSEYRFYRVGVHILKYADYEACLGYFTDFIEEMKEKNIDINYVYTIGRTLLSLMMEEADVLICSLFLDNGATFSSEVINQLEKRPLIFKKAMLEYLIEKDVDLMRHNIKGIKNMITQVGLDHYLQRLENKFNEAQKNEKGLENIFDFVMQDLNRCAIPGVYIQLEYALSRFSEQRVANVLSQLNKNNVAPADLFFCLNLYTFDSGTIPLMKYIEEKFSLLELDHDLQRIVEFTKKCQNVDLLVKLIEREDKVNLNNVQVLEGLNNAFEDDQMKKLLIAWFRSDKIIEQREHYSMSYASAEATRQFLSAFSSVFCMMNKVGISNDEISMFGDFKNICVDTLKYFPSYVIKGNIELIEMSIALLTEFYGKENFAGFLNSKKLLDNILRENNLVALISYSCYLAYVLGEAPENKREIICQLLILAGAKLVEDENGQYQRNPLLQESKIDKEWVARDNLVAFFMKMVDLENLVKEDYGNVKTVVKHIESRDEKTECDLKFMEKFRELFSYPELELKCPICLEPMIAIIFKTRKCGTCHKQVCWECYERCKNDNLISHDCPICRAIGYEISNPIFNDLRAMENSESVI